MRGGFHNDKKMQSTSKCLYLNLYSCRICTLLSNFGLFNFGTVVKIKIGKYAKQIRGLWEINILAKLRV